MIAHGYLVQTYWDFAFGVNSNTGGGKLNGCKVEASSEASLNLECGAYAFGICNCHGAFNWSFADGNAADAARQVVTKAADTKNMKVEDMLYYSNGSFNLGYHYDVVAGVDELGNVSVLEWEVCLERSLLILRNASTQHANVLGWRQPGRFTKRLDI